MKTLLLNGSPNGKKGNSQILINKFDNGFTTHCECICIRDKSPKELASYMREFECIIICMPLYIHAMPGIVMKLFEAMQANENQAVGFIIQSGFVESFQSRFAVRLLERQTKRLGSKYLGTVIRPGAAGVKMMPEKANTQLFEQLKQLGKLFEQNNHFDEALKGQLEKPIVLSSSTLCWYHISTKLRIIDFMWYIMLKQNHAFKKRNDRPFFNPNK